MDLPSKNMYDTFKDEIWKELAPLDPNWFEVLTASVNEGNGSDQDDLCANQEGHFKTPFDKAAGESQLFSTPKVFRRSRILSPEAEDEQSFTAAQDKETSACAATQSPCLFPVSKERVPGEKCGNTHSKTEDEFDLLHTPSESPVSYAKHISESLGAQINPDISWTSSLNTPPAIPSTLILSQTDEKPCPPSVTPDRKFIFVRKLFPSLSKGSTGGAPENNNNDTPADSQGAVSTEAHGRSQALTPSEGVWQQKVPDAIKDGDVRSTIAGILDGAEDVLSVLFANSSSSLRKVKPERIKWKPIVEKKGSDSTSTDALSTHKTATGEEKASNLEPRRLPSSPLLKTGHSAISQWSPLSLLEIPPCNEDNNILTEELRHDADPSPLARPSGSITHTGLVKKKRQFVHNIGNLKSQDQEKDSAFQNMDSLPGIPNSCNTSLVSGFLPGQELNVNHLEKAPPDADCCSTRKMEVQRNSVEANVQDVDISQLSRDFAQDFSQMSDVAQQSKVAKDAQHIFSPSVCLSAMKQAKQKVRQANLHHDCDSNSNGRHISTFEQNRSISEGAMSDSGFQSAAANITRLTATPFDPQSCGFKTDIPVTTPFPATKRGNRNTCMDAEAGTTHLSEQRSNEKQMLELRGERESHPNNTSTQQPSHPPGTDGINCTPSNGQYHDILPEKMSVSVPSTHASGFKTASNKGIHISRDNLERAKRIFEETEGIQTCRNQSPTCDHATKHKSSLRRSVKNTSSNSSQPPLSKTFGNFSSQLTASQKADVTDLCSFLEEAESQFEFTQSKTAKIPQHCQNDAASPRKAEKELDSDLLAGINFDDSFSSDAEKHQEVNAKPDRMASVLDDRANIKVLNTTSQSMNMPLSRAPMRENSSVPLCLEPTSGERRCLTSAEPKDLHSTEYGEVSRSEDSNTPVLGVGFKTARGNVLKVSKKSLSKARALFVDFEKNLTGEKSPHKQNHETDAETRLECNMDSNTRKADLAFTLSENTHGEERNQDCLNKQARSLGNNYAQSLRISNSDTTLYQSGFQKASGKQISVPANYLEKADAFFRDCVGMDSNGGMPDKSIKHENIENKKIHSKYTNLKVNIPEGHSNGRTKFETANAGLVAHNTKAPQADEVGSNVTQAFKNAAAFQENPFPTSKPSSSTLCATSKDIGSSGSGGFCTASGNKISVSADALKRAEALLKDGYTPEDIKRKPNLKENASKSEQLNSQVLQPKNGEFQTASGKEVSISLSALKKAQTLLNECNEVDKTGLSLPHHKIPVTGPPQCNSGFSTASGKPVAFSSEALQKAKTFFSDISSSAHSPDVSYIRRSEEKHEAARDDVGKVHCGLPTASGADVHIQKNLLKAKQEYDDLLLSNAMQEADAFFKDFDMDADDAMLAEVQNNEASVREGGSKKKDPSALDLNQRVDVNISKDTGNGFVDDTDEQPKRSGFQTGSGKAVSLLSGALSRASDEASHSVLNLCEEVEDKMGATPPPSKAAALPFSSGGFRAASGKPVAVSSEALLKAKSLFIDISLDAEKPDVSLKVEGDGKQDRDGNTAKMHCGFRTAGGAKVHVSRKNLLKAEHLLNEYGSTSANTTQEADALLKDGGLKINSEISEKCKRRMDSVKGDPSKLNPRVRVMSHVPEEPENGCSRKEVILQQQPGGFQTASGNAVAVSHEALKRAKTLLSDCEEVLPAHSMLPVTGSVFKSGGFFSASGKPVAVSSEALQKAEGLFGGVGLSRDAPGVSDARRSDKKHEEAQTNGEKMHSGFTTAAGGKVLVSEQSLLNAKNVLKEFSEEGCHHSSSSTTSRGTHALDLSKGKAAKRLLSSDVAVHGDGDIHAQRRTSPEVEPFPSLQQTRHANKTAGSSNVPGRSLIKDGEQHTSTFKFQDKLVTSEAVDPQDIPEQEVSHVFQSNVNQTNSRNTSEVTKTDNSSVLNLQSLNLSGCTVTQQKFLAQEALDCTKALLEDEDAAGQSLSPAVGNMQVNSHTSSGTAEEERGRRKRVMGEPDHIGQPPSKRRLLEEFDKTVDGSRASVLNPVKSCPVGLMKDRAVFKYSDSLHPNITKPHSDGKNYAISVFQKTTLARCSVPADSRLAPFKMPAFVPPFIKSAKTETGKDPAPKENARMPTFVPPFKKQKTVMQDRSSKQHKVENQHHQPLTEQPKSSIYVPPAQKTRGTTDVTALAGTTNANMMNNQSVPVNCASVSSGAKASYVDVTSSKNQEMYQNLENTELARDMQDMRIRKKKRQTIRPLPGTLFRTKTSGVTRVPLKVAVNGSSPGRYTPEQLYAYGVHKHVPEITSETAEPFRFSLLQFIKQEAFLSEGGVKLADGGWLIPSNDWTAGKEEFYRALCDTPGVDPKLITETWVHNHYRWVVWKLASMEKSFPEEMGSICLTPEQVLLQLKYRYDVEVDHSRRSALKKIMERDDTAAKTLVLCVSEIISRGHVQNRWSDKAAKTPQASDAKVESPSAVVWLTDGWYAIKAQLDEPLTAMLQKGLLAIGGKLIIHGAQLVGSQDACSPLEAPESLMLKIYANSTRHARWDAKLGFHRDPRPFLLPVSSFYSTGGPVGCVDIIVLRSYPVQWMERKPDGGVVFRSARAEEKEARRYNSHKQKAMEMLFAKIQGEFEKEERGRIEPQRKKLSVSIMDIASLEDGQELHEAVGDDPAYLQAQLSEQQLETLRSYRLSLMEKKQAELQDRYHRALEEEDNEKNCPKRDVTPVWRLSIADSMVHPSCVYQLNLWRPSSDLQSILKEGCRYKIYNLVTSEGKKRSSAETVQFTGTKKTQFQELQASQEWLSARFQPRVSTNFVNLQNPDFHPLCEEVDLTGVVISVIDGQGSSPAFYLADEKWNFVKVRCFSSLSQVCLEDVVKPRVLLALSNLQLRGQSINPTPVVYAGDLTVVSTNPKDVHLQESLSRLKNMVQGLENFYLNAEERLSDLIKSEAFSLSSPAQKPQTPASATDKSQGPKISVTSQKLMKNLGPYTPVIKTPAATPSAEKDPRILKRRRALDYLSRIPSPPPLSHLGSVASPCMNKTFNPPRKSGTPSTLKTVQTPAQKSTEARVEDELVNDEELAMIDTQALLV